MRLIDADALKEKLKDSYVHHKGPLYWKDALHALFGCIENEQITPTIDPVKHGHWMYGEFFYPPMCSVCKMRIRTPGYIGDQKFYEENYPCCPHCGAKMYLSLETETSDNGGKV